MLVDIPRIIDMIRRIVKFRAQDKESVSIIRRALATSFEFRNFLISNSVPFCASYKPQMLEDRAKEYIREVHRMCELSGDSDILVQEAMQRAHNEVSQYEALNAELTNWLRYFTMIDYVIGKVVVEKCWLPFIWKKSLPARLMYRLINAEIESSGQDIEQAVIKCALAFHEDKTSPRDVSGTKPCTVIKSIGKTLESRVPMYKSNVQNIINRTQSWSLGCYQYHYRSLSTFSENEFECFAKLMPKKIRLHMYWSVIDNIAWR